MENKPTPLQHLVAEGTAEGMGIAVELFVINNKIDARPTLVSNRPVDDAIILLTSEYSNEQISYPFGDESLKKELDAIVLEYLPAIEMLFKSKDISNLKKLVRWITCGQMLEFLEPRKERVRELLLRVRMEGLIDPPLPKHGPGG